MIAIVFRYDVREAEAFEEVFGPNGEWARFFRQGAGYIGTELLRDVEELDRYMVIDRWESADAYNSFVTEHQSEYLHRGDDSRLYYLQELRLGTFENVWAE